MRGTRPTGYEKRADGWWILGFRCGEVGPYRTKDEATEGASGLVRFYKYECDDTREQTQGGLFDHDSQESERG